MLPFFSEVFRLTGMLRFYAEGKLPDYQHDIRIGLYLSERARNVRRPDHFLREAEKATIGRFNDLRTLVVGTLNWMSERYLRSDGHRHLCVPAEHFESWQSLLAEVPPSLMVANALRRSLPDNAGWWGHKLPQKLERIGLQVRHSFLASVREPALDRAIVVGGLDEIHMHLNGATEAEIVWLDALLDPASFAEQFVKGRDGPFGSVVAEQLQQVDPYLTHDELLRRLRLAERLRKLLAGQVLTLSAGHYPPPLSEVILQQVLIDAPSAPGPAVLFPFKMRSMSVATHIVDKAYGADAPGTDLAKEALFLGLLFNRMEEDESAAFAHAVYAYLLLQSQFMQLLVQQRDQYGFDQFQKITVNEMREMTEARFDRRFHQLAFSVHGDLDALEGRFAPKTERERMEELLSAILRGYQEHHGRILSSHGLGSLLDSWKPGDPNDGSARGSSIDYLAGVPSAVAATVPRRLRLALVAHFIKVPPTESPDDRVPSVRHQALRNRIEKQWRVLKDIITLNPRLSDYLVGFDAAGNELYASPEVFAPVFRMIRDAGFGNFTYHAGEDFVHLLSGVRAVIEVLTFLEMGTGNRLGHATAIGLEPSLWRKRIGPVVIMREGDRLDDIVVADHWLAGVIGSSALARLHAAIGQHCQRIYGRILPSQLLYEAWEMRSLDPLTAFGQRGTRTSALGEFRREFERVDAAKINDEACGLFDRYHGANGDADARRKAARQITVHATDEPLGAEETRILQDRVLEDVRRRGVAIEVLPTSNVRIGVYDSYAEHHMMRWLGLRGPGPTVPICIGSDDPGIFATNIRNEFAHVLRELRKATVESGRDPHSELMRLVENGKTYRFSAGF